MFSCSQDDILPPNNINEQEEIFNIIQYENVPVVKSNKTKIYAHYMPIFQSKDISGTWGVQWPMTNKDPDKKETLNISVPGIGNIEVEKREIAAHYYPLVGAYDSGDPHLHEYHLLLMKYSGIDGLIIDFAGAIWSWGTPHHRVDDVNSMIPMIQETGLEFSMMYEDRDINWALNDDVLSESDIISTMQRDMKYYDEIYFNHSSYTKHDGRALLTIFGPAHLNEPSKWDEVLSVIKSPIDFYTLWGSSVKVGAKAKGEFSWPYNTTENNDNLKHLEYFHKASTINTIQVVFPGFKDYYYEGGWNDNPKGLGWESNHEGGKFFDNCISIAKKLSPNYVQIATWNDIAEGTMIEPTLEIGFNYLNKIQEFSGVSYKSQELIFIYELYQKRKKYKGKELENKKLDQVYYYLISLQTDKAKELLNEL